MPDRRNPRPHPDAPWGERPFRGWAWRGADLTDRQRRLYIPGRVVRHLGIPALRTGEPSRAPVLFAVRVHLGWRRGGQVALPAGTRFEVWAVLPLPAGGTCVVLEQQGERASAPGAFRRSLEGWLKRIPADPAAPDGAEALEQGRPFARWLPESRTGDPPLEGPTHDFEEAVRFASAWSGLEEALTWRILEAHGRGAPPGAAGIDAPAIAAACRGEMAYLDHLGLITWEGPGEREARLGEPAWPLAGLQPRARR